MATIVFPHVFLQFTNQIAEVEVEADTLTQCFSELASQFPQLAEHIFDADLTLQLFVAVWIDGNKIEEEAFAQTQLNKESQITFIVAMSGG